MAQLFFFSSKRKSANRNLFKYFYNEEEMEKSKLNAGIYFIVIP